MAPVQNKSTNFINISIYGLISSVQFQKVKYCAKDLYVKNRNVFKEPTIKGMLEFEWADWLKKKKAQLRGETWSFNDTVMVFANDEFVGDGDVFLQWASGEFNFEDFRNETLYETLKKEDYASYLEKTGNDFVYMDFSHDKQDLGRIVIELFKKRLPKTCENFRLLCSGEKGRSDTTMHNLHFKNTIINRIVTNGWIQGGDIVSGKGNSNESVYGGFFEDETFEILHNKRGMVGMANTGRHTNGSQFYITLQPSPWMDKKYVAFGQVAEGSETLAKLENIATQNERPLKECKITDCGIYEFNF